MPHEKLGEELKIESDEVRNVSFGNYRKMGHYSLMNNKVSGTREVVFDDSNLSYLVKIPSGNFDIKLNDGPYTYGLFNWGAPSNEKLDELLRYFIEKKRLKEALFSHTSLRSFDFITFRGVLTRIMTSPYLHDEWMVGACLYQGTIYLCPYYQDEEIESMESINRRGNYFIVQTMRFSYLFIQNFLFAVHELVKDTKTTKNLYSFMGYRFEQLMTSSRPNQQSFNLDPFKQTFTEYSLLVNTQIGPRSHKYNLLYAAEIDALDEGKRREDQSSLHNFVEIKTTPEIKSIMHFRSMKKYKMIKWWAQCFLVNIPKLVVGYRNDENHCTKIETMRTDEIPNNCSQLWSKAKCIDFLYTFLDFVHKTVTRNINHDMPKQYSQVFLFSTFIEKDQPSSTRKILVHRLNRAEHFSILPYWFVDEMDKHKTKEKVKMDKPKSKESTRMDVSAKKLRKE